MPKPPSLAHQGADKPSNENNALFRLVVVRRDNMDELQAFAQSGDAVLRRAAQIIPDALNRLTSLPGKSPPLCLCCSTAVTPERFAAISLVLPVCPDRGAAMVNFLCAACGSGQPADLQARALSALQGSGLNVLTSAQVGHS